MRESKKELDCDGVWLLRTWKARAKKLVSGLGTSGTWGASMNSVTCDKGMLTRNVLGSRSGFSAIRSSSAWMDLGEGGETTTAAGGGDGGYE